MPPRCRAGPEEGSEAPEMEQDLKRKTGDMMTQDIRELLHQVYGLQQELEAILKQVARMEQAQLKEAEKPPLGLRFATLFVPGIVGALFPRAGSGGPSPEQGMREFLVKAISGCEEMRDLLERSAELQPSQTEMAPFVPASLRAQANAVNFDDILRHKQLLQKSHAGDDISALVRDIEACHNSYQKLMRAIQGYSNQTSSARSESVMETHSQTMPSPPPCGFSPQGMEGPQPGSGPAMTSPSSPAPPYSSPGQGIGDPGPQGGAQVIFGGNEPEAPKPEVLTDDVQFRAVAPASLQRDSYAMLKVMMYRGDDYEQADREARRLAEEVKEDASGLFPVQRCQKLTIRIQSADVQIEEDTQELVWNGKFTSCGFEIFLPADFAKKQVRIKGRVYQGLNVLTDLRLILDVEEASCGQSVPMERCALKSAFISYASQDRSRVSACIRGMLLVCPDMDLFFDAVSLRRGERYEKRILREIENRDLFYLFWSRHASLSQWVNKELEHALKSKGADCIEPVPLEPPDICPPPQALNDRHFNDWILRFELEQHQEQPPVFADYVLRSADGHEIAIPKEGGIVGRNQLGAGYLSGFQEISGAHLCVIPQPDGSVFIEDLESTNGTLLNGQRIHGPVRACAGSQLTLGGVDFSLMKRA